MKKQLRLAMNKGKKNPYVAKDPICSICKKAVKPQQTGATDKVTGKRCHDYCQRTKRNPSEYAAAVKASESFHGTPVSEIIEVKSEVFEHDHLADLGELISMEIAACNGGTVKLHGFDGARLAQAPKGYPFQLFVEGGDQAVDLAEFGIDNPHELEVLGKLKRIRYYTVKHHLGRDGGEANYVHKLGEVSGKLPHVIYDVMNESLSIAGGEYTILPEGIDN